MKILGLTGGIGMGKSTSAQLLQARGVPVVDTDDLARQVVEPGQPALAEVLAAFDPQIAAPDGRLRRDELRDGFVDLAVEGGHRRIRLDQLAAIADIRAVQARHWEVLR